MTYCLLALASVLLPLHMYGAVQPNTVVATVTVGVTPGGLAITPDGKYVYVANDNNYTIAGESNVSVIDTHNNLVLTTINDASFNGPYTVTINPAGTIAYVTNSVGTTITRIDIATNTVLGTINGFNGPSGMVITPDGTTGYVNNYGAGNTSGTATTVNVVDLTTNLITGTITVGLAPAALAITPDGAYVYVVNYVDGNTGTGTASVIQTSNNTVVHTITGFSGPFDIVITPDGKYAYVTNFGSNNFEPFGTTISVIDIATNTITDTIQLGIQPAGVAITPDGKFAYATNYNTLYTDTTFANLVPGQGTVNIIDIATNTVLPPTIAVDQSPANIAITPDGTFAYVTNYTSNTVNVIALPTCSLTAQGCTITNRFLLQQEIVNKLTWSATGTSLPVSYALYRDANLLDLVTIIPATTTPIVWYDHGQAPGATATYYLVGINSVGTASIPLEISVTQAC